MAQLQELEMEPENDTLEDVFIIFWAIITSCLGMFGFHFEFQGPGSTCLFNIC